MSAQHTGGPAFPIPLNPGQGWQDSMAPCDGMTLRDYFAAKAMQGLVAGAQHNEQINLHGAAEWSYNMADAMLKAKEA